MVAGIVELDIHGMTKDQAKRAVDARLKSSTRAVYRIRVIHGYQRGTELRDMIRSVYRKHPGVIRIELGLNPGQTDLILREL